MPSGDSILVAALTALARAEVDFVVVGVGGINFYAADEGSAFATLDLDVLLAPDVVSLRAALSVLRRAGFVFEAGGEPFVDVDDAVALGNVVRSGANVTARHARGAQIDVMLSMTGLRHADLVADAVTFKVAGVQVRVGRLEKLLRSKEITGRPKDVEFLRLFAARFRKDDARPKRARPPRPKPRAR